MKFNALCTPVHHCPNMDNMHHTYVTASDHQHILNTTPPTTITTKSTTTTTTTSMKNGNNSTNNQHLQPWYLHQRLDNGPNNASRVVWAHGEFFYFSLCIFLILNIMDSYYWSIEVMEGLREGSGEKNRPKRRNTHRLGHSVSFFIFLIVFFYILTMIVKLRRLQLYGGPLRSLRSFIYLYLCFLYILIM